MKDRREQSLPARNAMGVIFLISQFPRQNPANVTRSEPVGNEIRAAGAPTIILTTIAIKFSRAIVNVGVAGKRGRGL